MAQHQQWHMSGWAAIIFAPVAIVLGIVVNLFAALFGMITSADMDAADVRAYLEDFIAGRGGDWDWDDFTSIPITDPSLDRIRREAAAIELPITEDGITTLRNLVERVREA